MAQLPCIGLSWPLTNPPFGSCAIYFPNGVKKSRVFSLILRVNMRRDDRIILKTVHSLETNSSHLANGPGFPGPKRKFIFQPRIGWSNPRKKTGSFFCQKPCIFRKIIGSELNWTEYGRMDRNSKHHDALIYLPCRFLESLLMDQQKSTKGVGAISKVVHENYCRAPPMIATATYQHYQPHDKRLELKRFRLLNCLSFEFLVRKFRDGSISPSQFPLVFSQYLHPKTQLMYP